jgi:hypothetical protein
MMIRDLRLVARGRKQCQESMFTGPGGGIILRLAICLAICKLSIGMLSAERRLNCNHHHMLVDKPRV